MEICFEVILCSLELVPKKKETQINRINSGQGLVRNENNAENGSNQDVQQFWMIQNKRSIHFFK